MSRELRLGIQCKIKSLIVRGSILAIQFILNLNDIINSIKLRLIVYRTQNSKEAEVFLTSLDILYKCMQLAILDPLSLALFFYREISIFFKYYIKVGEPSIFGYINQYFRAIETNKYGILYLYSLLQLYRNTCLSSLQKDIEDENSRLYRDGIIQYKDSVFIEVYQYSSLLLK